MHESRSGEPGIAPAAHRMAVAGLAAAVLALGLAVPAHADDVPPAGAPAACGPVSAAAVRAAGPAADHGERRVGSAAGELYDRHAEPAVRVDVELDVDVRRYHRSWYHPDDRYWNPGLDLDLES